MKYLIHPITLSLASPLVLLSAALLSVKSELLGALFGLIGVVLIILAFILAIRARRWWMTGGLVLFHLLSLSAVFLATITLAALIPQTITSNEDFYNKKLANYLPAVKGKTFTTSCMVEDIEILMMMDDYTASCMFTLNKREYEMLKQEVMNSEEWTKSSSSKDESICSSLKPMEASGWRYDKGYSNQHSIYFSKDHRSALFTISYF